MEKLFSVLLCRSI